MVDCMSTNSQPYLSDLLTVYTAARQLRSCSDNSVLRGSVGHLSVSYHWSTFRSIAYFAPSTWNSQDSSVASQDPGLKISGILVANATMFSHLLPGFSCGSKHLIPP